MAREMTVHVSMGRPAEYHDKRAYDKVDNVEPALASENETWIGDDMHSDEDCFNRIFTPAVEAYNAKQKRKKLKYGPESSDPKRQKSYYQGIVDGTFTRGHGDEKEVPIHEEVLGIGGRYTSTAVSDATYSWQKWKELRKTNPEEASEYALAHLSNDPDKARAKRILHRSVDRIAKLDPEHLVVIRANCHADEPNGSIHAHLAYVMVAHGYTKGLEMSCAQSAALEQMGITHRTKENAYGMKTLRDKFKQIIEEEMAADALEYGYEPMTRKADSGEHRKHIETNEFVEMRENLSMLSDEYDTLEEKRNTLQSEVDSMEETIAQREEVISQKQAALDRSIQESKEMADYAAARTEESKQERERLEAVIAEEEKIKEETNAMRREMHDIEESRRLEYFRMIGRNPEDHSNIVVLLNEALNSLQRTANEKAMSEAAKKYAEDYQLMQEQQRAAEKIIEAQEELKLVADTDQSRERFMKSHIAKDGLSLEEHYQQDIARNNRRMEIATQKKTEAVRDFQKSRRLPKVPDDIGEPEEDLEEVTFGKQ